MDKSERIKTKDEIKKELTDLIEGPYFGKKNDSFLTPIGKKVTLTKWIKEEVILSKIYTETNRKPHHERYYLGDYISIVTVVNQRRTVEVMKDMRWELNQTTNTK